MNIKRIEMRGFKRFRFSHIDLLEAKFTAPVQVITAPNGAGKYLPNSEPIKIPGGWTTMGEVKVGDIVTAWDGTPSTVLEVHPQGMKDIYQVVMSDGRVVHAGGEHLWGVYIGFNGICSYKVCDTNELREWMLNHHPIYLPLCMSEDVADNPDLIHPVEVGRILVSNANQGRALNPPAWTDFNEVMASLIAEETKKHLSTYKSDDKIWEHYLTGSTHQRLDLLHGLGIVPLAGTMDIGVCSSNKRLMEWVQKLLWSLGYSCKISERDYLVSGSFIFSTSISRGNEPPKSLDKCWELNAVTTDRVFSQDPKLRLIEISDIKALSRKEECTCISIDHPDKLYVTTNHIVTHNSSLLRELCPLPSTRTDYDKGGYRIIDIQHENHDYTLTSDFNNKSSPHSFIMDSEELNVSGTSSVQTELVIKHFGITPAIRDLVYSKTRLCSSTPSDRKTLFLSTNPMELKLILDTHKKSLSKIRYYKDNLQHLHARKIDLEGQMIDDEVLQEHHAAKETYTQQVQMLDKLLTTLENHLNFICSQYRYELDKDENSVRVPEISSDAGWDDKLERWAFIDKTNTDAMYSKLVLSMETLRRQHGDLMSQISKLKEEINEYTTYIDQSSARPINKVEADIEALRVVMGKYTDLPDNPVPPHLWDSYHETLERINKMLFIFRDISDLLPVEQINLLETQVGAALIKANDTARDVAYLEKDLSNKETEIQELCNRIQIPEGCQFTECRLAMSLRRRLQALTTDKEKTTAKLTEATKIASKAMTTYQSLRDKYQPYEELKIVARYNLLLSVLNEGYFRIEDWNNTLYRRLRSQPLIISAMLEQFLIKCKESYEWNELNAKYQNLQVELKHMTSQSGNSIEFIKNIVKEKEAQLIKLIDKISDIEYREGIMTIRHTHFVDYADAVRSVESCIAQLEDKENILIVKQSMTYWANLHTLLKSVRESIVEDLYELSAIVKQQETIRATYTTEILANIEKYEKEKDTYHKLEVALSPTTGLPHKSMVKYLNVLIHNVNNFISRIWNYKLKLLELDEYKPIDYQFKVAVGSETIRDISGLSDGQQEVVNFAWILTILLQLKMLDKVPLFADELGRTFDAAHRNRVFAFIGNLIDNHMISQMFLVNHFAVYTDGFRDSQVLCLSKEDARTLPGNVNDHVTISTM